MDWSTIITDQPCEQCGRIMKAADAEITALRGGVARLREAMEDYIPPWEGYSSTMLGPCPVCRNIYYVNAKCVPCENIALRSRIKQLEEAVEWALESIDIVHEAGISGKEFKEELKRRAGEG